jgi:hypothetical protein
MELHSYWIGKLQQLGHVALQEKRIIAPPNGQILVLGCGNQHCCIFSEPSRKNEKLFEARGYVSRAEFAEFDDVGLWWKEVMIFKFDYDPEIDRWERGWQTSHTHTSWQRLEYISLVDIRGQIK